MRFYFCFCFFIVYSDRKYEIYNRIFFICVITARIKKYKSIIKKKKNKHDKIVLLAKSKLNRIEVLIYKVLADSNISHDEFVLIDNVLKEFYDMKEKIKNSNDK